MTVTNKDLLLAVWNNNSNEVRRLLSDNDLNINEGMEETGWTPLILAVKKINPEIVELLLNDNRLDINKVDIDEWSAYKYAVLLDRQFPNDPRRRRIIQLLESKPELNRNERNDFKFDNRGNMGGRKTKRLRKRQIKKIRKARKTIKTRKARKTRKTQKREKKIIKKYKN
jgi:hypothetical protein